MRSELGSGIVIHETESQRAATRTRTSTVPTEITTEEPEVLCFGQASGLPAAPPETFQRRSVLGMHHLLMPTELI